MWYRVVFSLLLSLYVLSSLAHAQMSDTRSVMISYTSVESIKSGLDLPSVVANDFTTTVNVRSVACYTRGGTVTINPVLTGKSATSVLQRPLVCTPDVWTSGALQTIPTPQLRTFATNGSTCSSTSSPCTMDVNVESFTGAPTYLLIKVVLRRP